MIRRLLAGGAVLVGVLAFTASAGATTLGLAAPPTGAAPGPCLGPGTVVGQMTDDPSTPFTVPSGGGVITQWATYTTGDTAGTSVTFLVLDPVNGGSSYTVVGTDTETIPTPLPASGEASFTLATPIHAAAGDTLGIYTAAAGAVCFFDGPQVPTNDVVFAGTGSATTGQTLTYSGVKSTGGYALNLSATLVNTEDAGVQASTIGSPAGVGAPAVLTASVSNNGPELTPISFTDQVPAGLQIQSATAGLGTCAVSGQLVTCTITGLAVGTSASVDVVVVPAAAGSYTNDVTVSVPGSTDPTSSNNTASATLAVNQPKPTQQCIVPKLPKIPTAAARTLLKELGCTVHVSTKHSSVTKGLVIGVKGKTGSFPYHQAVTLIVSSGRKPKKRKRH
jgi:uncharacterized repeat protein (TIGR01451 family)